GFRRTRTERWGMRTLDLDLLAVDQQVLPDRQTYERWRDLAPERQRVDAPEQLILPHPRVQDRAFVLVPLADIAPDWRHPVLGQSVAQMLAARPKVEKDEVTAL
ncbi:2-amino-4-hydroxy-6-hydroxymethyldihydropteridine diphosphokinase, partial [Phaeobacter sp. HF9A]|uniref:2-amino-4-hydroxy-6- hydroxymethyldihydropteridine diphosphokinase n=1 Tax=Phaeobacter sp. HF9A TaxID=2721561 RepID=UPI00143103DE